MKASDCWRTFCNSLQIFAAFVCFVMESDVNDHVIDLSVLRFVGAVYSAVRLRVTIEMNGVKRIHSMYSDIQIVGKESEAEMLVAGFKPDSTHRQNIMWSLQSHLWCQTQVTNK